MLTRQKKAIKPITGGFRSFFIEVDDSTECCCDCRPLELDELDLKPLIDYLKTSRDDPSQTKFWSNKKTSDSVINAQQRYQENLANVQKLRHQQNKAPPLPPRKNGFELLSSFLLSKEEPMMIRYGKLLNRQFGFPDVLSRILWRQLSNSNGASESLPASEFCYLVDKAVEKLIEGGDLSEILLVVSSCCPHLWKCKLDEPNGCICIEGEKVTNNNEALEQQLTDICTSAADTLLNDLSYIIKVGLNSLESEMILLMNRIGSSEAEGIVNQTLKRILVGDSSLWMLHGQNWITKMSISTAKGVRKALKKRNVSSGVAAVNAVEKLLRETDTSLEFTNLTIEQIASFKGEISKISSSTSRFRDIKNEFNAWTINTDIGKTLRDQTVQLVENWTREIVKTAIETRETQRSFRKKPWKRYVPSSDQFVRLCLRLMKKTLNPQLFALIVREKVPCDPYCIEALVRILSEILFSFGVDTAGSRFGLKIDSSAKSLAHQTADSVGSPNVLTIKAVKLTNGTCRFVNPRSAKSFDCLFACAIDVIRERYAAEIPESRLHLPFMRQQAALLVEKDSLTWNGIRNNWNRLD